MPRFIGPEPFKRVRPNVTEIKIADTCLQDSVNRLGKKGVFSYCVFFLSCLFFFVFFVFCFLLVAFFVVFSFLLFAYMYVWGVG